MTSVNTFPYFFKQFGIFVLALLHILSRDLLKLDIDENFLYLLGHSKPLSGRVGTKFSWAKKKLF
jgi:hypothetical protein